MRLHEIPEIEFEDYLYYTGKMINVPKELCGNNKLAGNKVFFNGKWHLVLNSTQNQIELASIVDDFTSAGWVKRKYCKQKDVENKHPKEIEKNLSRKWDKNVKFEVTSGCQLHGDKECRIYIDGILTYECPWNY